MKLKSEVKFLLVRIVEIRIRYLERLRWNSGKTESIDHELLLLNQLWADLCGEDIAEELDRAKARKGE